MRLEVGDIVRVGKLEVPKDLSDDNFTKTNWAWIKYKYITPPDTEEYCGSERAITHVLSDGYLIKGGRGLVFPAESLTFLYRHRDADWEEIFQLLKKGIYLKPTEEAPDFLSNFTVEHIKDGVIYHAPEGFECPTFPKQYLKYPMNNFCDYVTFRQRLRRLKKGMKTIDLAEMIIQSHDEGEQRPDFGGFFIDSYTDMLAELSGDTTGLIDWFVFENNWGKKGLTNNGKKVRSIKKLYKVLSQGSA